jgi:hypothetical protein
MSSLQELVLLVARKATATTEIKDTQSLGTKVVVARTSFCCGKKGDDCDREKGHTTISTKVVVERTSSCTDKKCEDFKGEKGHTMIGQMLSVCLIIGEKYTGEEGQATICSNVTVAVPVLTRKVDKQRFVQMSSLQYLF